MLSAKTSLAAPCPFLIDANWCPLVSQCPFKHDDVSDSSVFRKIDYYITRQSPAPSGEDQKSVKDLEAEGIPLRIPLDTNSKFPWNFRQQSLEKIYDSLPMIDKKSGSAIMASLEIEHRIYMAASNKMVYKSLLLKHLSEKKDAKRMSAQDCKFQKDFLLGLSISLEKLLTQTMPISPSFSNGIRRCCRCSESFDPEIYYTIESIDNAACKFHPGRLKTAANGIKKYSCCFQSSPSDPCSRSCHVFMNESKQFSSLVKINGIGLNVQPIVAIDCEMVYTTLGMEVARVSIVSWDLVVLLDLYVTPHGRIVDYNSQFSGVFADDYTKRDSWSQGAPLNEGLVIAYDDLLQHALPMVIDSATTIVVGHSVDNDLTKLGVAFLDMYLLFL